MKYRIWHICQVREVGKFFYEVRSLEEAWKMLNLIWDYDSFQYDNNIKGDYVSTSGLEYFDEENNEWREWYDEDGYDISEHFFME